MENSHHRGAAALAPIDPLVHFKTAARDYLGASASTAYRLIKRHNVPIVQVGRRKLIRHSAMADLLRKLERESQAA